MMQSELFALPRLSQCHHDDFSYAQYFATRTVLTEMRSLSLWVRNSPFGTPASRTLAAAVSFFVLGVLLAFASITHPLKPATQEAIKIDAHLVAADSASENSFIFRLDDGRYVTLYSPSEPKEEVALYYAGKSFKLEPFKTVPNTSPGVISTTLAAFATALNVVFYFLAYAFGAISIILKRTPRAFRLMDRSPTKSRAKEIGSILSASPTKATLDAALLLPLIELTIACAFTRTPPIYITEGLLTFAGFLYVYLYLPKACLRLGSFVTFPRLLSAPAKELDYGLLLPSKAFNWFSRQGCDLETLISLGPSFEGTLPELAFTAKNLGPL